MLAMPRPIDFYAPVVTPYLLIVRDKTNAKTHSRGSNARLGLFRDVWAESVYHELSVGQQSASLRYAILSDLSRGPPQHGVGIVFGDGDPGERESL